MNTTIDNHREIPPEVLGDLVRFLHLMRLWYGIHYSSGIAGTAAGAAAGLLAQNLFFGLTASSTPFLRPCQRLARVAST